MYRGRGPDRGGSPGAAGQAAHGFLPWHDWRSAGDKCERIAYGYVTGRRAFALNLGEVRLRAMDPVLLNPLIALVAGVLILLMPRILNYVVAIYLIAIGIIGLAQHLQ